VADQDVRSPTSSAAASFQPTADEAMEQRTADSDRDGNSKRSDSPADADTDEDGSDLGSQLQSRHDLHANADVLDVAEESKDTLTSSRAVDSDSDVDSESNSDKSSSSGNDSDSSSVMSSQSGDSMSRNALERPATTTTGDAFGDTGGSHAPPKQTMDLDALISAIREEGDLACIAAIKEISMHLHGEAALHLQQELKDVITMLRCRQRNIDGRSASKSPRIDSKSSVPDDLNERLADNDERVSTAPSTAVPSTPLGDGFGDLGSRPTTSGSNGGRPTTSGSNAAEFTDEGVPSKARPNAVKEASANSLPSPAPEVATDSDTQSLWSALAEHQTSQNSQAPSLHQTRQNEDGAAEPVVVPRHPGAGVARGRTTLVSPTPTAHSASTSEALAAQWSGWSPSPAAGQTEDKPQSVDISLDVRDVSSSAASVCGSKALARPRTVGFALGENVETRASGAATNVRATSEEVSTQTKQEEPGAKQEVSTQTLMCINNAVGESCARFEILWGSDEATNSVTQLEHEALLTQVMDELVELCRNITAMTGDLITRDASGLVPARAGPGPETSDHVPSFSKKAGAKCAMPGRLHKGTSDLLMAGPAGINFNERDAVRKQGFKPSKPRHGLTNMGKWQPAADGNLDDLLIMGGTKSTRSEDFSDSSEDDDQIRSKEASSAAQDLAGAHIASSTTLATTASLTSLRIDADLEFLGGRRRSSTLGVVSAKGIEDQQHQRKVGKPAIAPKTRMSEMMQSRTMDSEQLVAAISMARSGVSHTSAVGVQEAGAAPSSARGAMRPRVLQTNIVHRAQEELPGELAVANAELLLVPDAEELIGKGRRRINLENRRHNLEPLPPREPPEDAARGPPKSAQPLLPAAGTTREEGWFPRKAQGLVSAMRKVTSPASGAISSLLIRPTRIGAS